MDWEKVWGTMAAVVVSGLLVLGAISLGCTIKASGMIDYCYIQLVSPTEMAPQYKLVGHVPWRNDRSMGVYPTLDEAKSKADALSCPVH